MFSRRGLLFGAAAVAAPAIIRPGILMPVKRILMPANDGVALVSIAHPWSSSDPINHPPGWSHVEIPVCELRHASCVDEVLGVVIGAPRGLKIFRGDVVARR